MGESQKNIEGKSSFASISTDEKTRNEIDIYKIINNEEKRTTVMIRNIPNKFKQMTLLEMINAKNNGRYDYFYLPMDLKVIILIFNFYRLNAT